MLLKCVIIFASIYSNVEFVTTAEIRNEASNESPKVFDTIVVGLGAAGAGALAKLARRGRHVLGLEAMGRVGGRVKTVHFGNGTVEEGAEWIHGVNNSVTYELTAAHNVSVAYQDGAKRVFRSDGSELDPALARDLIDNCMDETNLSGKQRSLGDYYTHTCMEYITKNKPELAKDQVFIEQWLRFLSLFVVTSDAADDWKDISALSAYEDLDQYLTASWDDLGYKTLFEILLNTFNNGTGLPTADIKLNKEVTQLVWSEDPTSDVVVKCADGSEYRAKHVIVTVSVGVLKHSYETMFSPALPQPKVEAIKQISMGVLGKIILSFEKRWWEFDDFFFGFMWSKEDVEKLPQDDLWTSKIVATSYAMGADTVLVMWTNGATARHIETLSDEVVKEQAMKLLRKFMGPTVPEATGIIKTSWFTNPFTRGTYTYDNLDTPTHPHIRADLATPLVDSTNQSRVLFAGEATHETHFSTVHGALETGLREANRLLGEDLSIRTLD